MGYINVYDIWGSSSITMNESCPNIHTCRNYRMRVSDDLKDTYYERPFLLLGCPSMKENPSDCKFYKEILKFNKIDEDFRRLK